MKYLFTIVLALLFSGCQIVHSFEVVPTPYYVLEHGSPKTMHLTIVDWGEYSCVPFLDNWRDTTAVLSETPPASRRDVKELLKQNPVYLRLGQNYFSLNVIVSAITEDLRQEREDSGEPIRWIVSLDPLIVARGKRREPEYEWRTKYDYSKLPAGTAVVLESYRNFPLGSTAHLITKNDLDELATAVFILQKYPESDDDLGGIRYGDVTRWMDHLKAQTRRVELPSPTRLSDLLANVDLGSKEERPVMVEKN